MEQIVINLNDEMFADLQAATREVRKPLYSVEKWCTEAIECILAERRLKAATAAAGI